MRGGHAFVHKLLFVFSCFSGKLRVLLMSEPTWFHLSFPLMVFVCVTCFKYYKELSTTCKLKNTVNSEILPFIYINLG